MKSGSQPEIENQVYPPRRINTRSTRDEVATRRAGLFAIVDDGKPMTVRQVFYQATVQGLVPKTEQGYGRIKEDLVKMRLAGELPYDWLADNTRWQRRPRTFQNPRQALQEVAAFYRKSSRSILQCVLLHLLNRW
jgi:hypothetical protein